MFKNMKIGMRLGLGFGFFVPLLCGASVLRADVRNVSTHPLA